MFIAQRVSIEVVRALRPVVGLVKTQDKDLADQILRAASSVALNLGEGSKREGRDRGYHYRIAAGSCERSKALLTSTRCADKVRPKTLFFIMP